MTMRESLMSTTKVGDSIFRRIFNNPIHAVELYEMVSGETCDPDEVEICTLPDDSMLSRFNDVAFRVRDRLLFFFEHQSTPCPNMPIRMLRYFADVLFLHPDVNKLLYGNKLYRISKPEFYVLYDGAEKWNSKQLFLSEAFGEKSKYAELCVDIINCKELNWENTKRPGMLKSFLDCMVRYRALLAEGKHRDVALKTAFDEAIASDGLFSQFLKENFEEVLNMMTLAYDRDAEIAVRKAEGIEEGREEGREEGISEERARVARNMLKRNAPVELISEDTGLTLDEIYRLKESMLAVG